MADITGVFTPHTSTTTAPRLNSAEWARIHGTMESGGKATKTT